MITIISVLISVVLLYFTFKEKQGWLYMICALAVFLVWGPWFHTFPALALVMWFLSIVLAIFALEDILAGQSEGWSQIKRLMKRKEE